LLKTIVRRRSSPTQQSSLQPGSSIFRKTQPSSSGESTLDPELHSLRREKNALLQEVARLKKEHSQTIEHMNTLNQRLETAEDRQKQVVSFLAKLLQNPDFLRQLKMHRERREEIDSARVKRKFLKHAPHGSTDSGDSSSPRTGESGLELPASSPAHPIAHDAIADLQSFLLEDTDLSDGMLPDSFGLDGVQAPEGIGALVQGFDMQDELGLSTGAELLGMPPSSGTPHCQGSTIGRSKGKNVMWPGLDGTSSEVECLVSLPDNMGVVSPAMAGKLVDADDEQVWGVDAYLQSSCSGTDQQASGSLASDPYLVDIANKPERFWELDFEALDDGELHLDKCVIGDPALQQHRRNMQP
jgi:heat shock transcription factor